jgi:hypothetical protein
MGKNTRQNSESGKRRKRIETDSRGRVTLGSEYADEEFEVLLEDVQDIEDKDVYFHRLGIPLTERSILDIFMQRRLAMDWEVGGMKNPWVFEKVAKHREKNREDRTGKGVRADARNFYRLSQEGGIVAAYFDSGVFRSHGFSDWFGETEIMLIGEVEPGTAIEPVEYPHKNGLTKYVNTLQMVNAVDVHEDQHPELFEGYPKGTIRKWDSKEELVREAYEQVLEDMEDYAKGRYEPEVEKE